MSCHVINLPETIFLAFLIASIGYRCVSPRFKHFTFLFVISSGHFPSFHLPFAHRHFISVSENEKICCKTKPRNENKKKKQKIRKLKKQNYLNFNYSFWWLRVCLRFFRGFHARCYTSCSPSFCLNFFHHFPLPPSLFPAHGQIAPRKASYIKTMC